MKKKIGISEQVKEAVPEAVTVITSQLPWLKTHVQVTTQVLAKRKHKHTAWAKHVKKAMGDNKWELLGSSYSLQAANRSQGHAVYTLNAFFKI